MTSSTSRVLAGRYHLDRVLGRGGMATVFRATDDLLGRTVAVKVLSDGFAAEPTHVERFRREAQAAAKLNHANVVSVFDTGSDGDVHYIVMEYVDGETLADLLRREASLPPEEAVELMDEVAAGLQVAHEEYLIHRDVKPSNIMLPSQGGVKVADFGIARAADAADQTLTRAGTVLGTAAYQSPEQVAGKRVDARSDIYSLGCVMYEVLTGRPPFQAESSVALAVMHTNAQPEAPSSVNPRIPASVEAVVMRALAKDPDKRYPSAAALREALRTALIPSTLAVASAGSDAPDSPPTAVLTPTATQPLSAERIAGWARSWRWTLALVAIVLGAALLVVVLSGGNEAPGTKAASPASPARPSPSSTPPQTLSPTQAASLVRDEIRRGEAAGTVGERAARQILKRMEEVLRKLNESKPEEAMEKVREAQAEVAEFAGKGEITTREQAAALDEALDALFVAIQDA